MNAITDEYSHNFTQQLSKWCHEHNVFYTGHIIEDMGCHFGTGCSSGHFFKSMRGADYASVDTVFNQIKPYYQNNDHLSLIERGYSDNKFFSYTLCKLASSCAVQSESAKGRALCEIFGAYGWGESISDMLYLANHAAISGINNFIPHAFSMNLYDTDCPPYFNGEGLNTSYEGYKKLFKYLSYLGKFSHKSYARVAVYYNADSAWSNSILYSIDDVAMQLMQHQIEFDFIDFDNIKRATVNNRVLKINSCEYDLLIIPNGNLSEETSDIINGLNIDKIIANNDSFTLSIVGLVPSISYPSIS